MFLGVQIVSIAVLFCIIIAFMGLRKIPILSTKWYGRFLVAAAINFGFELFSLYTIYNIDTVSESTNRLAHQLFMTSLIGVLHCFLWFIDIKGRNQRRYTNPEMYIRMTPFLSVPPIMIFGEVNYYVDGAVRYSYGSMVTGTIVLVAIYLVSYFLLVIHFRKQFSQREVSTFIFSLIQMTIILIVQATHPNLLLTSMGVMLLALNVFMTFENPREHADQEILHALNKNAFLTMVNERVESKKEFYVVSMTLTNSKLLKNSKGYNETIKYVEEAAIYMKEYARTSLIFHPKRDWVSIVFSDKTKYFTFMEEQREVFEKDGLNEHGAGKYFMSILKCPEYAGSVNEIISVMDYVDRIKGDIKENIVRVDDDFLAKKRRMAEIEVVVQKAIETEGFDVYYQPIYSNKAKRFVSAEALVRLRDTETLGYISPEVFIPIAEENGMIGEVGNIVFKKVCQFISENNLAELGIDYVEVNLSGAQFLDHKLNEILASYVREYNVPPEFINLEITETASIEAGEMLEYNMKRLKECRFRFSMDDFGTGYSNLAKMADIEFDLIKLDKTLIWPCFEKGKEKEARVILDACINMIHNLGKQIVAEGVETKEQVDYLTERGVRYLQGYYFSRPVTAEKYLEFMKKNI